MSFRNMSGYSIIEILVVMAILASAMAIVVPSIANMINAHDFKSQISSFDFQLSSLSKRAFAQKMDFNLTQKEWREFIELDESINVTFSEPVRINNNGVCIGGEVIFRRNSNIAVFSVSHPYCGLRESDRRSL